MQIFRSGIKGKSRKRAEWGVEMGESVGVEGTKVDKRKTEEDKEGERECRRAQIKEPATKCTKGKSREELKVRQKYKLNPVVFQRAVKLLHCTGTGKCSAGVISVTDKELYAQRGVRRGVGLHRERGTCLHNWPCNCQQLVWSRLAALKPLWVQILISCVYQ